MQIQAKTLPRHLGLFGLWLLDVAASLFVLLGTALYFLARHQARHIN